MDLRRSFLTYFVIISLGLAFVGYQVNSITNDSTLDALPSTINIGFLSPQTGTLAHYSNGFERAANLSIQELNLKYPNYFWNLTIYNTNSDPVNASIAMNNAVGNGSVFVLGAAYSTGTLSAAPIAKANRVPLISYASTSPNLTTFDDHGIPGDEGYLWRIPPSDGKQGVAISDYAKNQGYKTAVLVTNSLYHNHIGDFVDAYTTGLNASLLLKEYSYNSTNTTSTVSQIKLDNPEVVITGLFEGEGSDLFVEMDNQNANNPVIGFDGISSDSIFNVSPLTLTAMQNVTVLKPSPSLIPSVKAFQDAYKNEYLEYPGLDGIYLGETYDAVWVGALAVLAANSVLGADIIAQLALTNYDGGSGHIEFDVNGDITEARYEILRVQVDKYENFAIWHNGVISHGILLGGLFPLSGILSGGGVERGAAFRIAIERINADPNLLPDTPLLYIIRDTATDPVIGVQAAQYVIAAGAVGIVGAAASAVSKAIASGPAKTSNIPQISYSSTDPILSDKTTYPYFLRVVTPDQIQGIALANMVNDFEWSCVSTLATTDEFGLGGITEFENTAISLGIQINSSQRFAQGTLDVTTNLQAINNTGCKIIILNIFQNDAITVFSQAANMGMTSANGYVWLGTDGSAHESVFSTDNAIKQAMQGMIGTRLNTGFGPIFEAFLDIWQNCNGKTPAEYAGCGDRQPNPYATFAYDAVYTYAHAFERMIASGKNIFNGDELLAELYKTNFTGAIGPISFDQNGDREGLYDIVNLQGNNFIYVGTWDTINKTRLTGTIYWDGFSITNTPVDRIPQTTTSTPTTTTSTPTTTISTPTMSTTSIPTTKTPNTTTSTSALTSTKTNDSLSDTSDPDKTDTALSVPPAFLPFTRLYIILIAMSVSILIVRRRN